MAFLSKILLALAAASHVVALPEPGPSPTPAPRLIAKRDTCNGDNCLNAMRQNSASASSFCSSYTSTTSPTSTPTYLPSTCGSARLSSACYCLAVPTYPPQACPTGGRGQLVHNPSFYGNPPGNFDITPWVIAHTSGSEGCRSIGSYSQAYVNSNWGDPRAIECKYDTTGGADSISQDLTVCPGKTYKFTANTACDWYLYPNAPIGVKFRVQFNGQTIVPWQYACQPCDQSSNSCNYPRYAAATANVVGPTNGKATIKIDVAGDAGLSTQAAPLLLDQIFLQSDPLDYSNPDYS